MLTRLEADGFKNLINFSVDLGPYTCIAGINAVGKSNVFDLIQFLSRLADLPFMEATQAIRSETSGGVDPKSLFWADGNGATTMTVAAEMIVAPDVVDDFGRAAKATTTFLRYELELEYVDPMSTSMGMAGNILLKRESLNHINVSEARAHMGWPHSKKNFRDYVV
ncbi:hypothetical protein [Actinomyces radicidentis]|uniref:hypothetical protein n=1 Tax=Actinomyces radicidentis TaxID=111015 RepID=UPI0026DFDBF4|nr:hypothetical protein [Actinomyces radicidentis]